MLGMVLALSLSQTNTVQLYDEGTLLGPVRRLKCVGSGIVCTLAETGSTMGVITVTTGGGASPLTTKGDIYTRGAAADDRLPVGVDGQCVKALASTATGLEWGTCGTGAAPDSAPYVTFEATGALSAERVLTNGTNTTVDVGTAGQTKVNLSGTVPQTLGGTGAGSTTCSAGQALTSNGTAYSCTAATFTGTNTGDVTVGTFGSSPNANGVTLVGQLLALQPASTSFPGGWSTGNQTFPGAGFTKTFDGQHDHNGIIRMMGTTSIQFFSGSTNFIRYVTNYLTGMQINGDNIELTSNGAGVVRFNSNALLGLDKTLAFTDTFTATIQSNVTADRLITLPNADGTLVVGGGTASGANTGDQTETCTNQFMRTLAAGTGSTCESVAIADHSATGTPSATTFLRGDNTWATPAGGSGISYAEASAATLAGF